MSRSPFAQITEVQLQRPGAKRTQEYRVELNLSTKTVTCSWGPVGAVSVSQTFACVSLAAASELAAAKVAAKTRRGYATVGQAEAEAPLLTVVR